MYLQESPVYRRPMLTVWALPGPQRGSFSRFRGALEGREPNEESKRFVLFDEIFPPPLDVKKDEKIKELPATSSDNTFHRAMGPVLAIGQFFAVMPVTGILGPNAYHLSFRWTDVRVVLTVVIAVLSCCIGSLSGIRVCLFGADIGKVTSMIFYGSTSISLLLFLKLAPQWPQLGRLLEETEPKKPMIKRTRSLRGRFIIVSTVTLSLAMLEHLLSYVSGIAAAQDCGLDPTLEQSYFQGAFPQVFYFTSYARWKAAIVVVLNSSAAFNWNFTDLFIIVISIALTDRFQNLNERLEAAKGKDLPAEFWRASRQQFAQLAQQVRHVDHAINGIVLLSFANNLYFICLQLFNTLDNGINPESSCGKSKNSPLWGYSNVIYFTFSFGFLLGRSLMVSLKAAALHAETKRPAAVLYVVPSTSYCSEIHRLLNQVVNDTIALTGFNFFYVTRGLILSIAGTIVTYELVLVQFNADPPPLQANFNITQNNCTLPTVNTL